MKHYLSITLILPLIFIIQGCNTLENNQSEGPISPIKTVDNNSPFSPEQLWKDYDPRKEPLNEEVLKTWQEGDVTYKEVYFNGEKFDGKFVRIYGIYAAPTGSKNLPAVLHLHGGGQTVSEDWLKEFTKRDYAILSINWGGEWPRRDKYTLWNGLENGDHRARKGTRITLPTPKKDAYYRWSQAAMRSITYLESQKEVNPEKLGAFGISMGGSMMWNLAFDSRIKAGSAIYGAGWNTYTYKDLKYAVGNIKKEPSENDKRWRKTMAPEASAPFIKFPMLFLSSTNDRHGYMDRAEDSLALIPNNVPTAWSLTPRFRHHIGADFVEVLPQWMDFHLKNKGQWPANATTKMSIDKNSTPMFSISPAQGNNVTKVEIFYSLETPFPVNRHWRNADVSKNGNSYSAKTPVMNANEYLFAFANIFYKSGVVISSPLEAIIPKNIGAQATTKKPNRVFYDGKEGVDSWTNSSTGTDPIPNKTDKRLFAAVGPNNKPGLNIKNVSPLFYAPSDPEFRAPKGASLQFDIKTLEDQDFAVNLHKNYWVGNYQTYSSSVALKGMNKWQTVTLTGADFINEKNANQLGSSINEVGVLELIAPKRQWHDANVIFRNFRWLGGNYVPHVHAYREQSSLKENVTASDNAFHLQDHEAGDKSELITNVKFNSANSYQIVPGGLQKGAKIWTDRKFTIGEIPKPLKGGTLIRTPMQDRTNKNKVIISFTSIEDISVYIAHKKGAKLPQWLSDWENTGLSANASNQLIYLRKQFKAGEQVVLGSGRGMPAMYSVVIQGLQK